MIFKYNIKFSSKLLYYFEKVHNMAIFFKVVIVIDIYYELVFTMNIKIDIRFYNTLHDKTSQLE